MDFTKFLEDDDSLLEAESLLVMNTPNFELIDDTEEFLTTELKRVTSKLTGSQSTPSKILKI